jgi:hypothetical protein
MRKQIVLPVQKMPRPAETETVLGFRCACGRGHLHGERPHSDEELGDMLRNRNITELYAIKDGNIVRL